MKNKKGQIQMSFGMIFSIIIIIATVAIAIYFIKSFLNTSECVEIKDFYEGFQKDIDSAWQSPIARKTFSSTLPNGIESVCIGLARNRIPGEHSVEFTEIQRYVDTDNNIFLIPGNKACDGKAGRINLEHIGNKNFFCKKVIDRKIEFTIEKNSAEDNFIEVKE